MKKVFYYFVWLSAILFACDKDKKDTPVVEPTDINVDIATVKTNLIGVWILTNSVIDGKAISPEDFSKIKKTSLDFKDDNSFELTSVQSNDGVSSTRKITGDYEISDECSIKFSHVDDKIVLQDKVLTITHVNVNGTEVINTFTRKTDINVKNTDDIIQDGSDDQNDTDDSSENDNYDGTEVIAFLKGKWNITNSTNESMAKNNLEFSQENCLVTQHKKTFTIADLYRYNVGLSGTIPSDFQATITCGNTTAIFDRRADCQMILKTHLRLKVIDARTVTFRNNRKLTLTINDDSKITLKYEYTNSNGEKQTACYNYEKESN